MDKLNKKKESKVTVKTHCKHHPLHKEDMKQVRGGIAKHSSMQTIIVKRNKG